MEVFFFLAARLRTFHFMWQEDNASLQAVPDGYWTFYMANLVARSLLDECGGFCITPIRTNLRTQRPVRRAMLEKLGGIGMFLALIHVTRLYPCGVGCIVGQREVSDPLQEL